MSLLIIISDARQTHESKIIFLNIVFDTKYNTLFTCANSVS